jgi:hypothetical protein
MEAPLDGLHVRYEWNMAFNFERHSFKLQVEGCPARECYRCRPMAVDTCACALLVECIIYLLWQWFHYLHNYFVNGGSIFNWIVVSSSLWRRVAREKFTQPRRKIVSGFSIKKQGKKVTNKKQADCTTRESQIHRNIWLFYILVRRLEA